jgi:hypothetical protein
VEYDATSLLLVVHQKSTQCGFGRYLHWGVLLDRKTFEPTHLTRDPLFDGFAARGRVRGALYVTSVVPHGSGFVFLSGEGDNYVSRCYYAREFMDRCWIKVSA